MAEIEGVAASGEVLVVALVTGDQTIVGCVVDPSKAEGGPEMVSLGGVVVDHVQDHLDPRIVEALHEGPEFRQRWLGQVARIGREEGDGVVAPVVGEPALDQVAVADEALDGKQLHGGDAEPAQVGDRGRTGQAGEGPPLELGHLGMTHGEPAHVQLVDHRLVPGSLRPAVSRPGVSVVDDPALGHPPGVVAAIEGEVLRAMADAVAEVSIAPEKRPRQGLRVGIQQELVGIEAMAALGVVGSMDAVAVELSGTRIREIAVPGLIGVFGKRNAVKLSPPAGIEEAELDLLGVLGEEREVHPPPVPGRAARIRLTRPDSEPFATHAGSKTSPSRGGSVMTIGCRCPCHWILAQLGIPGFTGGIPSWASAPPSRKPSWDDGQG